MEKEVQLKDGELDIQYDDFRKQVLNINKPRTHRIRNSVGTYSAYKWIRKNKWLDIGQPISEHDFYTIVRHINDYLAECLSNGQDVILPHKLGRLEIRKFGARVELHNGVIKTNLPVDWDKTLKLWFEDEEAYKERTLIKMEEKEIFSIYYNRTKANYENKSFYTFQPNRQLKLLLKRNIKAGRLDAFLK